MKLSKDELKQKISDIISDDKISIPLLEDVEDSFVEDSTKDEQIAVLNSQVEDLTKKYKERFLTSNVVIEKKEDVDEVKVEEFKPRSFEDLFNEMGGLK